ncbi:hypothetical protein JOM56_012203, partial [Amanita muscaria]
LPNIVGCYFPRRDDPTIYQFYCACMLMLLKPWCDMQEDLKEPTQTWSKAFLLFTSAASERIKFILSGIQYFHECDSAAQESRNAGEYGEKQGTDRRAQNYDVDFEQEGAMVVDEELANLGTEYSEE